MACNTLPSTKFPQNQIHGGLCYPTLHIVMPCNQSLRTLVGEAARLACPSLNGRPSFLPAVVGHRLHIARHSPPSADLARLERL